VTVFLSAEDVTALATHDVVMAAARAAVAAERAGTTVQPPRLDVDLPSGFLRVMPAAIGDVMGLKVMTLAKGLGTRYLVLVYEKVSGELVAVLDADEITRLRTAATTAVAGEILAPAGTTTLGLIGSGFEAEGHLRLLARVWALERVAVYSRNAERREAFARRMAAELDIDVHAVSSMEAAVVDMPISVLATKSTDPVVDGTRSARRGPTCASSIARRCCALRSCSSTTHAKWPRSPETSSTRSIAGRCRRSGSSRWLRSTGTFRSPMASATCSPSSRWGPRSTTCRSPWR
jgi:ornithine cyclodeaminase/alanine dehydrogenase-like protein (mu-crystallin family)